MRDFKLERKSMGLLGWSARKEKFLTFGCRDLKIQYIVYGPAAILKST